MIDTNNELIAKRWAKALMDLTLEDSNISKEDVLDDLNEISDVIDSSAELSNVINNPSVSVSEKQVVLCKLFQNNTLPVVYNFLYALNLKKRVTIIPAIAREFKKALEEMKNITHVGITTAINLTEERKEEIKNKISEKLKKEVVADWKVDSEIIAGLVLNIDETIVDNSIKHKLDDLSKNIMR